MGKESHKAYKSSGNLLIFELKSKRISWKDKKSWYISESETFKEKPEGHRRSQWDKEIEIENAIMCSTNQG